jgi:hypothetical protein
MIRIDIVLACRHADQVTRATIAALSATLDRDDPSPQAGDPPPPLWHRIYCLPTHRQSALADLARTGLSVSKRKGLPC